MLRGSVKGVGFFSFSRSLFLNTHTPLHNLSLSFSLTLFAKFLHPTAPPHRSVRKTSICGESNQPRRTPPAAHAQAAAASPSSYTHIGHIPPNLTGLMVDVVDVQVYGGEGGKVCFLYCVALLRIALPRYIFWPLSESVTGGVPAGGKRKERGRATVMIWGGEVPMLSSRVGAPRGGWVPCRHVVRLSRNWTTLRAAHIQISATKATPLAHG